MESTINFKSAHKSASMSTNQGVNKNRGQKVTTKASEETERGKH